MRKSGQKLLFVSMIAAGLLVFPAFTEGFNLSVVATGENGALKAGQAVLQAARKIYADKNAVAQAIQEQLIAILNEAAYLGEEVARYTMVAVMKAGYDAENIQASIDAINASDMVKKFKSLAEEIVPNTEKLLKASPPTQKKDKPKKARDIKDIIDIFDLDEPATGV